VTYETIGRLMEMALSQKHRSTIFQKLEPILGEEEAEALLSQFPARDLDEPVTREFVRAELAEFRAEVSGDIAELRTEMHQLVNRMFFSLMGVAVGLGGLIVAMTRIS
jgi:hypothetical protein